MASATTHRGYVANRKCAVLCALGHGRDPQHSRTVVLLIRDGMCFMLRLSYVKLPCFQTVFGLFQATGWPSVVPPMGHWFPKGE